MRRLVGLLRGGGRGAGGTDGHGALGAGQDERGRERDGSGKGKTATYGQGDLTEVSGRGPGREGAAADATYPPRS
ncbi:hypothetical protein GCM10010519_32690 [Streptomyces lactacystinicus]